MTRTSSLIAIISMLVYSMPTNACLPQSGQASKSPNEYIHMTGKIGGKYDVTMDISINTAFVFYYPANNVKAYYSYNNRSQPITLYGTFIDDSLNLTGGDPQDTLAEYFRGKYVNGTYIGEWSHGSTKLAFSLVNDLSGSVPADIYSFSDSTRLVPARADMQARVSYSVCTITDPRYSSLSRALYQAYWGTSTWPEVKDSIISEARAFFALYHDGLQFYLADTNMIGMENYQSQTSTEVIFNADNILVVGEDHYEYTGGAHGMSYRTFVSLNTASASLIKLEDILVESDTTKVKDLLEKKIRKYRGIPDSLSLQESGLFVTGNDIHIPMSYYFTPQGVMFVYNVYEIASYADGMTYLFIPFKELGSSIKRQSWMKF